MVGAHGTHHANMASVTMTEDGGPQLSAGSSESCLLAWVLVAQIDLNSGSRT